MWSADPPFDDTVQLEAMAAAEYFDDSDRAPIVNNEEDEAEETQVQPIQNHVIVSDAVMSESGAPMQGRTKAYITVATLLLINLLNYMDRFTVAGKYFLSLNFFHTEMKCFKTNFKVDNVKVN